MKVIILGSGILGVASAYYLSSYGHDVTVIDRQDQSGKECSFANGGQLSYSHVEPWANPGVIRRVPQWLFTKDSPISFKKPLSLDMWKWLANFLIHCRHSSVKQSTEKIWQLSSYSKASLDSLLDKHRIAFNHTQSGTLHIFSSQEFLQSNCAQAKLQKELGCRFIFLKNRDACVEQEPALAQSKNNIAGGLYFPMDEAGDIHKFTNALVNICKQRGVRFIYNTAVTSIAKKGQQVSHITTTNDTYTADRYIVALGAYSANLLRPLGLKVPIYPLKGYSLSINTSDQELLPTINITDQSHKIVYSRLGNTLRVAGLAEFAGYDHTVYPTQIDLLTKQTLAMFPVCSQIKHAMQWSCLRPATPDCLPIIGHTYLDNLYLNTGHGTLGWTLALGSGRVIADVIEGKKPSITLEGLTIERF